MNDLVTWRSCAGIGQTLAAGQVFAVANDFSDEAKYERLAAKFDWDNAFNLRYIDWFFAQNRG